LATLVAGTGVNLGGHGRGLVAEPALDVEPGSGRHRTLARRRCGEARAR
jgi:hypothetical protein